MRVHHRPIGREPIIEANLDRREQAAQPLVHLLDALRQKSIQTLPGPLVRAGRQHPDERLQFLFELAPLRLVEGFSGLEAGAEDVHYLARRWLRGFAPDRPPRQARAISTGLSPRERIDVPRADVQSEGRQQTAKDRELRKVIESDDDDVEFVRPARRDAALRGTLTIERAGHFDVCRDFFGRECRKIILVHPGEEILNYLLADFRTERFYRLL